MVGNVVARVLVWLIVFQPVYVAMGMELEDPGTDSTLAAEQADVQAPVAQGEPAVAPASDELENEHGGAVAPTHSVDEDGAPADFGESVDEGADAAPEESRDEMQADETGTATDPESVTREELEEAVADETGADVPMLEDETDVASDESATDEDTDGESAGAQDDTSHDEDGSDAVAETDRGNDGESSEGGTNGGSSSVETGDERGEGSGAGTASTTAAARDEGGATTSESASTEDNTEDTDAASTTDTIIAAHTVQNAANKYTFGEGDCTLVADGEFYCVSEGTLRHIEGDPAVYAEKDQEGDREIFYFDGIEIKRITNNAYDDFAPVFEEETQRIVWQSMVNDRLQVMVHELPTNTTRQVTTSRSNSSNPHIEGDLVVWQEWVDTNWEVMMTNVDNGGEAFDIERLTDNAVHDMFPRIYGDVITWQREKGGSWEVIVFDMRTGKTHALEKDSDTRYENPRFVLLFDSRHDNGDIETIGYDLDTGEMMELGTRSQDRPVAPVTPTDETQHALAREAASSTQIKVGREDGGDDDSEPSVL